MHGRLVLRSDVKGKNDANNAHSELEQTRCEEMGVKPGVILTLSEMARSDNIIFAATGITKGDLLDGIRRTGDIATTETLLIRGKSRTIRRIQSTHYLQRKDDILKKLIL